MSKRAKKWTKRVLLWAVGLPVALIIALVITEEFLPAKYGEPMVNWVAEKIFSIVDDQKAYHDFLLVTKQFTIKDYDKALYLCDSLEGRTTMPQIRLDQIRADIYDRMGQTKVAEFYYRKSFEEYNGTTDELPFYSQTAFNLSSLLYDKNDYEGALKVLLPVIAKMKEHEGNLFIPSVELPKLYLSMGRNLVALGRYEEGEQHYQEAIEAYKRDKSRYDIEIGGTDFTNDTAFYALKHNISLFASISYLDQGLYDQASSWLEESKENLRYLQEHFDTTRYNIPQRLLRQQLTEARLLVHQGKTEEAERIFRQFYTPDSKVGGKTKLECGQYLLDTRQWQEAIELYQQLDTNAVDAHKTTLDDITQRLVPQYQAWRGMGNNQKAIVMADSIAGVIDSAIVRWRNSDAMELATIYDTQGKEAQIAQKQAALTRLWWIATMIVLGLVILSFIIYTIYRRRITKMRVVQDRIESELRIARDIQMSMVPSVFPEREGLDMYASMTPAKEVGGDLYGYLLQGDKLYFAVGDVSGKGVPASLFMAQATRLFLTLAKQGMMPAEICTRMNDALSGDDNENGMFVTFWLGLVDLTTGRLDFCNAGHNPPVIGGGEHHGEFLDMIPNAPLGLWSGLEYEGEAVDSIKGRTLFLYTDGLNEAENPQKEQFGDNRLLQFLRNTPFDSARQVVEALNAEVETHRNGAEPNDDLTMMCLQIN